MIGRGVAGSDGGGFGRSIRRTRLTVTPVNQAMSFCGMPSRCHGNRKSALFSINQRVCPSFAWEGDGDVITLLSLVVALVGAIRGCARLDRQAALE